VRACVRTCVGRVNGPSRSAEKETIGLERNEGLDLFYDGQHGLGLVGRGGRGGEALGEVRVGHPHGVVSPHGSLFLGFSHDLCVPYAVGLSRIGESPARRG